MSTKAMANMKQVFFLNGFRCQIWWPRNKKEKPIPRRKISVLKKSKSNILNQFGEIQKIRDTLLSPFRPPQALDPSPVSHLVHWHGLSFAMSHIPKCKLILALNSKALRKADSFVVLCFAKYKTRPISKLS